MFRGVWLLMLHNLTLDGKLCLRDDKNAAFGQLHHHVPWEASMENVPEAVSDWLNPLSLGTMSASAYIDNLA